MAFDLGQAISTVLKQSGWHFLAIAVAAAFLAVAPDALLHALGLDSFRSANKQWIGLALVVSTPLALFSGVKWFVEESTRGRRKEEERGERVREEARRDGERQDQLEAVLRNLGHDELGVLQEFLSGGVGSRSYPMNHGPALTLFAKRVLYRPEQVVEAFGSVRYGLNDWVREFVRRNPELLRR